MSGEKIRVISKDNSMAKFKIVHNRKECIGCGSCAAVCEKYWELKEDKANLKGAKNEDLQELEVDNLDTAMDAAECCPVNCIHIYEEGEKKI